MAGATGLEPAASGVTGRRSNQLSYAPIGPRVQGRHHVSPGVRTVKPTFPGYSAPEYRLRLVGDDGFEPPTLSV